MPEATERVEKVYCHDRGGNDNALAAAILSRNNNGDNDMWPMMAMMGGGFGANQWMNNPFAYMMMTAWMRNSNGGNWDGNGAGTQGIEIQSQLQAIRSQMQNNENISLLRSALGDGFNRNDFALSQLSQNLNIDFNTMQKCCCDMQAIIQQVAGQLDYSAERVINAANMGDCNVTQAIQNCCCQTQRQIADFRADMQLQMCKDTGELRNGQRDLGALLTQGFSQAGFQAQQDKCDIIRNQDANTQKIIDTLNAHWKDEQALKIQDLKFELSQKEQTEKFAAMLYGNNGKRCNGNNGCGGGF